MIFTINNFAFIIYRVMAQAFNYYSQQYHHWKKFITTIREVSVVVLDELVEWNKL